MIIQFRYLVVVMFCLASHVSAEPLQDYLDILSIAKTKITFQPDTRRRKGYNEGVPTFAQLCQSSLNESAEDFTQALYKFVDGGYLDLSLTADELKILNNCVPPESRAIFFMVKREKAIADRYHVKMLRPLPKLPLASRGWVKLIAELIEKKIIIIHSKLIWDEVYKKLQWTDDFEASEFIAPLPDPPPLSMVFICSKDRE